MIDSFIGTEGQSGDEKRAFLSYAHILKTEIKRKGGSPENKKRTHATINSLRMPLF